MREDVLKAIEREGEQTNRKSREENPDLRRMIEDGQDIIKGRTRPSEIYKIINEEINDRSF